MSTLREHMQADLQLIGITPKAPHVYLREVSNFLNYFGKSPDLLGEAEVKEYLLYLLKERNLSQGTFRFYVSGLKFIYRTTLKREDVVADIQYPKRKKTLPVVVLALSEAEALFAATEHIKHRGLLMITYSAGLRLSETSRLKVTDIDSKRMRVRVEQGKRSKDRYTILSQAALESLRQYWREYRPKEWLFEGQKEGTHIGLTAIRQIFLAAKKRAGITKSVTVHSLRHAFATHLIEAGTSLHHVQLLVGHRSPVTTTVYLHVSQLNLSQGTSPLDTLKQR